MARVLFPRRRSATPSKAMPASASASSGENNCDGFASCLPAPSSPSSARAPSLPSNPAPADGPVYRESPTEAPAASKQGQGSLSSQSNLEDPSPTSPTSTSTVSATPLLAAVARRQRARAAASPSPSPFSPAQIERLWEEDHAVLLSAVEGLISAAGGGRGGGRGGGGDGASSSAAAVSAAPAAAAATAAAAPLPATPSADRKGHGRPRPPSSEPTPPPPPSKAVTAATAAGKEEELEGDTEQGNGEGENLTLPVAQWLRRHEPLLREAAAASAEARTFDTEAALLSLCAREGISPQKLAEECAKLSPSSPSRSSCSSSDAAEKGGRTDENAANQHPLGVDVAAALDRAAELRRALANFDEDARGDAPGFVTAADEESLRVRYRHVKGTTEHTVRFEATIFAPLEHLLALCSEIDLSPGWNRFVVDAAVVARAAKFCSFYYASQWSPRPFPQMDSCVRVRGHDAYDSSAQGAVVCLESWPPRGEEEEDEDEDGRRKKKKAAGGGEEEGDRGVSLDLPAAAAKRHRVLVLPGSCIVLAPVRPCPTTGATRTRGTLLVTLDPRLPFVPGFLVAWVLRVLAPAIKRGIDAVMASWFVSEEEEGVAEVPGKSSPSSSSGGGGKFGAEMRRRLAGRPELYELARRLVARHAAERGGELPASPPRLAAAARASAGGTLRRSSSEIPAAATAALRRRSSSSAAAAAAAPAIPASASSAVVDGGGLGGGEVTTTTTTTTTEQQQQQRQLPLSSGEDQGWISWLTRPLSATANYASSLLFVEQTVPS